MSKKISLGAAIAYMVIVMTLTFCITVIFALGFFNERMNSTMERENLYKKISEIDRKVRDKYYGVIDENTLLNAEAVGYMSGIGDPNGAYMTPEEYALYQQSLEGRYIGVGIVPKMAQDGFLSVEEVYPESPAAMVGIQAGDLVVKVIDTDADVETDVNTETYQNVANSLKGEAGTKITLVIRRENEEDKPLTLTRRQVEIPTVYTRIFNQVGYVKITSFSVATSDQFDQEIGKLINNGIKAVIFDLRDNKGGNIRACAETLDTLVGAGDIVSSVARDGKVEVLHTSAPGEMTLPMVVLTNENTADAAEIFVQVLKDFNKGKSVGMLTAGQGSVQEVFKLTDGSAIRLTVAHYASGKGVPIDGVGVAPDYEIKPLEGDLPSWVDLSEDADPQFKKAMELATSSIKVEETTATASSSAAA